MTLNEYMSVVESCIEDFDTFISYLNPYLEKTTDVEDNTKFFNSRSAVLSKLKETTDRNVKRIITSSETFVNDDSINSLLTKLEKRIVEMPDLKGSNISFHNIKEIYEAYKRAILLLDKRINLIKVNKATENVEVIDANLRLSLNKAREPKSIKALELKNLMTEALNYMKTNVIDNTIYYLDKSWTKETINNYIEAVKKRDELYIEFIKVFNKIILDFKWAFKEVIAGKGSEFSPSEIIKEYKSAEVKEEAFDLDLESYLDTLIDACERGEEIMSESEMINAILEGIELEVDSDEEHISESTLDEIDSALSEAENILNNGVEHETAIEESAELETEDDAVYEKMLDDIISEV